MIATKSRNNRWGKRWFICAPSNSFWYSQNCNKIQQTTTGHTLVQLCTIKQPRLQQSLVSIDGANVDLIVHHQAVFSHRSNWADNLFDSRSSFSIRILARTWHFPHHVSHGSAWRDQKWHSGYHHKSQPPPLVKCHTESSQEHGHVLQKLAHLLIKHHLKGLRPTTEFTEPIEVAIMKKDNMIPSRNWFAVTRPQTESFCRYFYIPFHQLHLEWGLCLQPFDLSPRP